MEYISDVGRGEGVGMVCMQVQGSEVNCQPHCSILFHDGNQWGGPVTIGRDDDPIGRPVGQLGQLFLQCLYLYSLPDCLFYIPLYIYIDNIIMFPIKIKYA